MKIGRKKGEYISFYLGQTEWVWREPWKKIISAENGGWAGFNYYLVERDRDRDRERERERERERGTISKV